MSELRSDDYHYSQYPGEIDNPPNRPDLRIVGGTALTGHIQSPHLSPNGITLNPDFDDIDMSFTPIAGRQPNSDSAFLAPGEKRPRSHYPDLRHPGGPYAPRVQKNYNIDHFIGYGG